MAMAQSYCGRWPAPCLKKEVCTAIEITREVTERLAREQVIWLTTTKADGTPLPNSVWFLWDGGQFLIFTEPGSVKMKNMACNERMALNLNSDFDGGEDAIFQADVDINSVHTR